MRKLCVSCDREALDGHLTCGDVRCDEGRARKDATSLARFLSETPLGRRGEERVEEEK